jgi:predicted nucleic acid-binding protein
MNQIATDLFTAVANGEEEITTSEVVLHEICFVLGSAKHYRLDANQISDYLRPLIRMSGFKFARGEKAIYLRALEIFSTFPKLEFADSVIAARAERLELPLATFDRRLSKMSFVNLWTPETGS